MNDYRKHTRKVQKCLMRKQQGQVFLEKITDKVTCWIPIICTCSIVLSMPKGSVPFLQWTIKGEAMAVLALAMLTPWGLYQMDHKCFEKLSDKWLWNILPTECVLWVIYCRIQSDLAIAFFLIGIIGSMLWRFSQKKDRNRYAAIVMTIALFMPSYYAVSVIKSDIRLMYHELNLFIMNGEESEYADKRNMESVPKCSDEEWVKMNSHEKLEFLREIASHETTYMCIPEILVCMETLNRDGERLVLGNAGLFRGITGIISAAAVRNIGDGL